MTLIVGIVCKDGIVLAADSQTTKGSAKQLSANKISVVNFLNGVALVAESGSASLSGRVVETFQQEAAHTTIEGDSTIPKLLEKHIRVLHSSLVSLHPGKMSPTELQDYFYDQSNWFELMLAYYSGDNANIYRFNPLWCIPVKAKSYFETSGIASELANYVLKEHTVPNMDSQFASVIAIKTVMDAIENVEGCGQPVRVAMLNAPEPIHVRGNYTLGSETQAEKIIDLFRAPQQPVVVFPDDKVSELEEIIARVEKQSKSERNKKIHSSLRKQTDKSYRAFMKQIQSAFFEGIAVNPAVEALNKKQK